MGCVWSVLRGTPKGFEPQPKGYHWSYEAGALPADTPPEQLRPQDLEISGSAAPAASSSSAAETAPRVVVRRSGSVNNQQVSIEQCSDTKILVCDHPAAVTMDLCTACSVFLGPVGGSVYVRNCKGCTVIAACQQFRARDCSGCTFYLYSTSRPVIEECSDISFGCFDFFYFDLALHFKAASLSVFSNEWYDIYDFTPAPSEEDGAAHFRRLEKPAPYIDIFGHLSNLSDIFHPDEEEIGIQTRLSPFVRGTKWADANAANRFGFVMFAPGEADAAARFLSAEHDMERRAMTVGIAASKEMLLTTNHVRAMLPQMKNMAQFSRGFAHQLQNGPVIGIYLAYQSKADGSDLSEALTGALESAFEGAAVNAFFEFEDSDAAHSLALMFLTLPTEGV